MKVPDKIYMRPILIEDGESIMRRCMFQKDEENTIEYIRKDAFIEKLETWLNKRHKRDRYTLIYFRKHFKDIINEIMDD